MKRYLITGGTGFIGSALTKALVRKGHFVRVFDNNFRGSQHRLLEVMNDIELVRGDIRSREEVTRACDTIESIIHLAYINGTKYFYESPELVLETAIKGIMNILDAGKSANVSDFFLASSSEVYQTPQLIPTPENVPMTIANPYNPRSSYGGGKIISELMTIHFGKKYFKRAIIFRPHNVYGPDMGNEHVIPELLREVKKVTRKSSKVLRLRIQGTGDETRAFIYIDDFIMGLLLVLENGKHLETYNIGTMEEVTIKKLIEKIGAAMEIKITTVPGKRRQGSILKRCPNIKKIAALGFLPSYTLEKGLSLTIPWYLKDNN